MGLARRRRGIRRTLQRREHEGIAVMAWVLLEVFLALGVAAFIVWWTFPKTKKRAKLIDARTGKTAVDSPTPAPLERDR